jgi:hypothetical protein
MNSILNYLRSRSPEAKNRILTATVLVTIIILGFFWINGIKNNLGGLDSEDLLPQNRAEASNTNYVQIEAIEDKNDKTYIYFKVSNNSSDILGFPEVGGITLNKNDKNVVAEQLINRQDQIFVKKILSNTTEFGALVFSKFEHTGKGTIYFDGLYFEQTKNKPFMEAKEINFKELKPIQELRS